MIIGAAVALVMALVVVGGIALVSSLNSESAAPGATSAATTEPPSAMVEKENKTVYARIQVVGESVKIYAAAPGNTEVYWNASYIQGEVRDVVWKDVDVTIYDSSAVRMFIGEKRFQLPVKKKSVSIQFVGGKPSLVPASS